MADSLSLALQAWQSLLGDKHVVTSDATRSDVATATFATHQTVLAILHPGNTGEVQACLQIANEYKIPIYVISRGKNWGYGSSVPVTSQSVILNLTRLDQIVTVNETLAYVTVQAGVTFHQLDAYLREHDIGLMINCPGSTPDASIVGHALERGFVSGLESERGSHILQMELVLPTGALIQTGYGRFENIATTPICQTGIGPTMNGLFTQSNLGLVTQMTISLPPRPAYRQTFTFRLAQTTRLLQFIPNLQSLIQSQAINASCTLFNDYRASTLMRQYPWKAAGGETPLPADLHQQFQAELQGRWYGKAGLWANSLAELEAKRTYLTQKIEASIHLLRFEPPNQPDTLFELSTQSRLTGMYWRKKMDEPSEPNPDRDRCGLIWFSPLIPFTAEDLAQCLTLIEPIVSKYQFEPAISLQCFNARTIYVIVGLIYDRDNAGEDQQAAACSQALHETLGEFGYLPYRLNIHTMYQTPPFDDDSGVLYQRLKQALDPNDILAPGRYDFRHEWPS
ncbi:MAG: FAD-binding oxidoreductase [Chloroflexota bacterium]